MNPSIPIVACDESGNTGQNLLDKTQPVFVFASVHFSDAEQSELFGIVANGAKEIHFADLKRRGSGRRRLKEFFQTRLLTADRVKLSVIHKPYLVTTKIVDLLCEPFASRNGVDIYRRGWNIGLSNVLHLATPSVCGAERFANLQVSFVRMIRSRGNADIVAFYSVIRDMRETCICDGFNNILDLLVGTGSVVRHVLDEVDGTALDPAVAVVLPVCDAWGNQFGGAFELYHDHSAPLAQTKSLIERLMDPTAPGEVVGSERRKITVPLKATGLRLVDSVAFPQVQLADLLASAWSYVLTHGRDDVELRRVIEPVVSGLVVGGVWPSKAVLPEELGTNGPEGENIVDGLSEFLARKLALVN